MVELKNIFYGANINIQKKESLQNDDTTPSNLKGKGNIFKIYRNSDINCYMSKRNNAILYKNDDVVNTFISKSVSYQDLTDKKVREVFSMPPKGPIHEHTFCLHCKETGPKYHLESCSGPYDDEILNEKGYMFYSDKISSTFSDEELLEIIEEENPTIFYKDIYPSRGIQKLSSENYRCVNFSNVVQYRYVVECDGKELIVPIKVTPYFGITLRNVPLCKSTEFETFQNSMFGKLIKEFGGQKESKIKPEYTWITNMNGIFKACGEEQILNLENVYNKIKSSIFNDSDCTIYDTIFSTLKGYITLKIKYKDNVKATVQIKRGGSVHIFISYAKTLEEYSMGFQLLESQSKDLINKGLLTKIANFVNKSIFEGNEFAEIYNKPKGLLFDAKVMNTVIPYKIKEDKKGNQSLYYTTDIKTADFPPQPSGCQNKGLSDSSRLIKANIRRPVPFSFTHGVPPMRNMSMIDEGIKSTSVKLRGDNPNLVEPCSQIISGKEFLTKNFDRITFSRTSNVLHESILNNFKNLPEETDVIAELNDIISKTTSVKNKMLRRALYGFPNNKYSEDSAEYNKIKKGIEIVPSLQHDEKLENREVSMEKTQKIQQPDINSAVYFPETQLKKFEGDNTFVRESRNYKGLFDYDKEDLLSIVSCYLEKLNIQAPKGHNEPISITIDKFLKDFENRDKLSGFLIPYTSTYEIVNINNTDFVCYKLKNSVYIINPVGNVNEDFDFKNEKFSINLPFDLNTTDIESIYDEIKINEKLIIKEGDNVFVLTNDPSDILKNDTIEFYVSKSELKNTIKLSLPHNMEELPNDLPFDLINTKKDKNLLFVPSKQQNAIDGDGVYKFYFNYYIDTDGFCKLVNNQPFILLENMVKNSKKKLVYKKVTNTLSDDQTILKLELIRT